jgi:hypothetical protein
MPLFVLVACIILHDMNPRREIVQTRHCPSDNMVSWNGDCWRAAVALRVINELEIVVVDIDHGVGVIRKRPNTHRLPSEWETRLLLAGGWDIMHEDGDMMPFIEEISYQELDANREVLLRLMSMNGLRRWLHEDSPENVNTLQYNPGGR